MSIGQRTQRGRLFAYSNVAVGGLVQSSYAWSGDFWCSRLLAATGAMHLIEGAAESAVMGFVLLADSVTVPADALFKVESYYYNVLTTLPRPATREQQVILQRGSQQQLDSITGEPTTLTLLPSPVALTVGGAAVQLLPTLKDAQSPPVVITSGFTVYYTSSDVTIATVDATGLVRAVVAGTCVINAVAADATASVGVAVT